MIAILSDFGAQSHFVGVLKGVIYTIHPTAQVVDLCHTIPPYYTPAASFILEKSLRYFPPATIFLAVVDPGVGSERKILLAASQKCLFIAPDNGLLTPYLVRKEETEVRCIEAEHFFLQHEHSTFEARDRMAPVAAQISRGINWQFMGESTEKYVINDDYFPRLSSDRQLSGMVIYIDTFGNLISNIPSEWVSSMMQKSGSHDFRVVLGDIEISELRAHFTGPGGKPFMLFGSHGNLEIAYSQASAAEKLKAKLGQPLLVRFS